jgi:response regulator RpfG family c-di-GMP phosphodiesterase
MGQKILLVDDDENILDGYRRNLRNNFQVFTATSGAEALDIIKNTMDIAVIVSDFKMPQMNGVEFLSKVKVLSPFTVRILLTGYADAETAINAVNESNIFRLLTKPCKFEKFLLSLSDALRQYELQIAEKELLEQTLKGSIKILVDVLSIVNPDAFKLSNQVVTLAVKLARHLKIENIWQIEMAALLSQIGCVAIPNELFKKKLSGIEITPDEEALLNSHPEIGYNLLKNIPRLQEVAKIIRHQLESNDTNPLIPFGSRILHVLNDYFFFSSTCDTRNEALSELKKNSAQYNKDVLLALDAELAGIYEGLIIFDIPFNQLTTGHVLADDILDTSGTVLITRGAEISELLKIRLVNYNKIKPIAEPIKIFAV